MPGAQVEPAKGTLQPGETCDVSVSVTFAEQGAISTDFVITGPGSTQGERTIRIPLGATVIHHNFQVPPARPSMPRISLPRAHRHRPIFSHGLGTLSTPRAAF